MREDFKDDVFTGNRKYQLINNDDGTISLVDATEYQEEGDVINAEVLNGIASELSAKQDTLTFDTTPTSGSTNPVTSDGVYQADKTINDWCQAIANSLSTANTNIANLTTNKADKTQLGTQVTYSLSGTTLMITTK